ncbi:glycosyltransferase [Azospirillum sp. TSO35-2]|nr:glycosyltransferase [Azospirillum sp. TSO35-2]
MTRNFAITWQLTEIHGWGMVGVHTALHLMERGAPPLLLDTPALETLRPENRAKLEGLLEPHRRFMAQAAAYAGTTIVVPDVDMLHALGNGFDGAPMRQSFRGRNNIGVIAFEDTRFDAAVLERARSFDRLVVHSTYNRDLLVEQGFTDVGLAFQGIDPTEIRPLPPTGRFGDRFVVFSGGKLEFRKGQDIVLSAFRAFQQRHPEALLVTAWQSPWPGLAESIAESPLTRVPPDIGPDGRLDVVGWATRYGIPPDAVVDLGMLGRGDIASVLADCNAAVFPNRCEGATNLVAMEAMGCGVPVVLSANTGHLDLIGPADAPHCWPLTRQTQLFSPQGRRKGWKESSVNETVAHLETIHADREEAKRRAQRALAFIHGQRTWSRFAETFIEACSV